MLSPLCFILGFFHLVFASNGFVLSTIDNTEYVVEATEDRTMNITCLEPTVISVTGVMYGRDSKWFPCENEDQSRIAVVEKCQYRSFCSLEVNDENFNDICRLELIWTERLKVQYGCIDDEGTLTTMKSSEGTLINGTQIQVIGNVDGVAFTLGKALTTTVGATIGVLSLIIVLLSITVLYRRYRRLKKEHQIKIEKENSSQSWLMASGEANKSGLQNIYTDPKEERQRIQSYNDSLTDSDRQSQPPYAKTYRGYSEDNTSTYALYSHTSIVTYDVLHKSAVNDTGENTLMYDHIANNQH